MLRELGALMARMGRDPENPAEGFPLRHGWAASDIAAEFDAGFGEVVRHAVGSEPNKISLIADFEMARPRRAGFRRRRTCWNTRGLPYRTTKGSSSRGSTSSIGSDTIRGIAVTSCGGGPDCSTAAPAPKRKLRLGCRLQSI